MQRQVISLIGQVTGNLLVIICCKWLLLSSWQQLKETNENVGAKQNQQERDG